LKNLDAAGQVALWGDEATDPRPRVRTGWPELDGLLRRGSFGPGTLAFLAGRMHTRKTAVMMNLVHNMLVDGTNVGLVPLDEAPYMYVSKLASVLTGQSHVDLDEQFAQGTLQIIPAYGNLAAHLSMTEGYRPGLDELTDWVLELDARGQRPQVVFIDYLALLERGKYSGKDVTRIPLLCEELQVWTNNLSLVTVVLHQVGRQDDTTRRYHGHKPITPEQLMYGGEQQADIILATYRPALDPTALMTQEDAVAEGISISEWQLKVSHATAYRDDTMLQLIKNRPGVHLNHRGLRLRSRGESQKMEVVP
jgi:replicative DNA helicase